MNLMKHFDSRKLFLVFLPFLIAALPAQVAETGDPGSEGEIAAEATGETTPVETAETAADSGSVEVDTTVEVSSDAGAAADDALAPAPPVVPELPPLPSVPDLPEIPAEPEIERIWVDDIVRIFADVTIAANEAAGDMVVIGGSADIAGKVQGDGVVVIGHATIDGEINGDMVNVMGTTVLGPEAVINGEMIAVGGHVVRSEGATIRGSTVELSFLPDMTSEQFQWLGTWFKSGLLLGRPLPHSQSWAWIAAGVLLLIALLISFIFRRAIDSTVAVLDQRPAASLLTGMLVFVLTGPLTFILMVVVVGIPVIPFLMLGLMVAGIFGTISVYRFSGQQFGLHTQPAAALLVGGALFTVLYAVPIVGFLTWFLAGILGTGAVFLALVQGLRREPGAKNSGPPPMSPISPTTQTTQQASSSAVPDARTVGDENPSDPAAARQETAPVQVNGNSDDPLMAERVGFWPRLGATALDFILIASLAAVSDMGEWFPLIWIAYHIVFWAWRQTTIGGIVLNLKVVRLDGQALGFGVVVVRSLASIFSGLVAGVGMFWASWDPERQSWHDKIAGTTIVRVPRGTPLALGRIALGGVTVRLRPPACGTRMAL
jgi:uncharacterized RDD family membrane protein YckC